jgi:hypothetical protein
MNTGRITVLVALAGLARAATAQCPPDVPTGLTASQGTYCQRILLNWNDVSGATSYNVYRNTTNNWSTSSFVGSAVTSQFTDLTQPTFGIRYYYWVTAFRLPCLGNNTSGHSAVASGYMGDWPYAPSNVSASDGAPCSVGVTWTQQPYLGGDPDSFTIYRNTSNVYLTSSSVGTVGGDAREFRDNTAQAGTLYFYWVRAETVCGNNASSSDSGFIDPNPPANDLCSAATLVSAGSSVLGDTGCAGREMPPSCQSTTAPDVWYRFNAPSNGTLHVDTCASGVPYDTTLAVFAACPATPENRVACNDDTCDLLSSVDVPVVGGNTYFIAVSGFADHSGAFRLNVGFNASTCYANCDGSSVAPVLTVADFGCFLNAFAAGSSYANCDGSTAAPVLTVADFGCFLNAFAAGCS